MTGSVPGTDVVVLAGGRSRRMGRDKATVVVDGERLVDRVVRRMAPVVTGGGRLLVAVGPDRGLSVDGVATVADDGTGPMAGVRAAMSLTRGRLVAVVAVDQPDADADVLRALGRALDDAPSVGAAIPVVDGHAQYLHAVYRRWLLEQLVTSDAHSFHRGLTDRPVRLVPVEELASDGRFAHDWDTPDDIPT